MSLRRRTFLTSAVLAGPAVLLGARPAVADSRAAGRDWMATAADSTTLDDLTIPGTHDTCAIIGGPFDTAKCQDIGMFDQLNLGVRFIDIRCRLFEGAFTIHHGPIYQEMNFTDVLSECRTFLQANPSETIIMSVQQEYSEAPAEEWAAVFNDRYMRDEGFDSLLYRDNRLPSLGEVRGRVVLIANSGHIGGIPAGNAELLSYQNDWEAPVDAKWELIRDHLDAAEADTGTRLYVNYTSTTTGAWIPYPRDYAEQLNPRTRAHVEAAGPRPRFGAVVMDFAEPGIVDALIACND